MGTAIATVEQQQIGSGLLALSPVMDLVVAKARLKEFQAFVADYLVEGEDYGRIPGVEKPTLFKPGSDKLCELYGLADTYQIMEKVTDWERGLFEYEIKCILINKRDGSVVSEGMGNCNSWEGKYRWRDAKRICPVCGKDSIIKGKQEYGGGWLCFVKKGGCGEKWPDGSAEIEGQKVGRVENDDIATLKNTILKMAKKRAKVDCTLSATRSSGIFTQDMEDIQETNQQARAIVKTEAVNAKTEQLRLLMNHQCNTDQERAMFAEWLSGKRTEQELSIAITKIERKIKTFEQPPIDMPQRKPEAEATAPIAEESPVPLPRRKEKA